MRVVVGDIGGAPAGTLALPVRPTEAQLWEVMGNHKAAVLELADAAASYCGFQFEKDAGVFDGAIRPALQGGLPWCCASGTVSLTFDAPLDTALATSRGTTGPDAVCEPPGDAPLDAVRAATRVQAQCAQDVRLCVCEVADGCQ